MKSQMGAIVIKYQRQRENSQGKNKVSECLRRKYSSFNILKSGQKRPSANAINSEVIAKGNSEIRLSGD